jgi:hypothetical protein
MPAKTASGSTGDVGHPDTAATGKRRAALVAIACALVAVLAAICAILGSQNGIKPASALVKMSRDEPMSALAREADPDFHFVNPQEHYDGVYYYAIALDPVLRGQAHTLIDQATYRYGHPMYGWMAAALSLGQARWVPEAMLALSLIGIGVAGWAISRLAVHYGRTPWGGLLVAASPGLLYATTVSTTETVGVALLALSVLAWLHGRLGAAATLFVMLCLTKENYVTVPAGLALWEMVQARRRRAPPARMTPKVAAVAAGPAALAGWYLYVWSEMGQLPSNYEAGNFGPPVMGWLETFRQGAALSAGSFDQSQIGSQSAPALIAIAVVLLAATATCLRMRSEIDGILLGMVVITACMGWLTLLYPHELLRNPAVVLLLATAVLLSRPATSSPLHPAGSPFTARERSRSAR